MNYKRASASDRAYVAAHRLIFGEVGEHVATSAILFRDRLMRPGFVLPPIRIARTSPYGRERGRTSKYEFLKIDPDDTPGVWLYLDSALHRDRARGVHDELVETMLHEFVHCELTQFGEDWAHKGVPWARRCQELSDRLGLVARIERPRSIRVDGRVTTGTPKGCLSYADLSVWPVTLLDGGPALRARLTALS